ncbi:MAG: DNA recombination protein RmuC [Gammaproteobacteria bacterium]
MLLGATALLGILAGAAGWAAWTRNARLRIEVELAAARGELKSQRDLAEDRETTLQQAQERLAGTFADLANKSLAHNSDSFLKLARQSLGTTQERARSDLNEKEQAIAQLIKPIREALEKTKQQIGEIEKHRHEAFGGIRAQLEAMAAGQEALQSHTRNLVTALRRPEVRGQWGELTLRRVVELAGMVEHCDFTEQAHVDTGDGAVRPDMVVRLPDRGTIVVDAKTPLDAYLTAVEADTDQDRKTALQRHARNVANRVRELAGKSYWSQFDASPEFVILFIPGDQFLTAALSENPNLLEDALREKVIIATPTSLVALLKAIAYGWRQLALDENAEKIRELAQDMHGRLSTFTGHLAKLGKQLEGTIKAYNSAVGSMDRKVLPGARKFVELGVHAKSELPAPGIIETSAREIEDRSARAAGDPPQITSIEVTDVTTPDPDDPAAAH